LLFLIAVSPFLFTLYNFPYSTIKKRHP